MFLSKTIKLSWQLHFAKNLNYSKQNTNVSILTQVIKFLDKVYKTRLLGSNQQSAIELHQEISMMHHLLPSFIPLKRGNKLHMCNKSKKCNGKWKGSSPIAKGKCITISYLMRHIRCQIKFNCNQLFRYVVIMQSLSH